MATIYKLHSEKGDKVYIGSTINLKRRIKDHYNPSKIKIKECASYILMEEYGRENVMHSVLEETDIDNKLIRERYWIEQHNTSVNMINPYMTYDDLKKSWAKENAKHSKPRIKAPPVRMICECGDDISRYEIIRHQESLRHQRKMNNI